jgi:hypothetical protein
MMCEYAGVAYRETLYAVKAKSGGGFDVSEWHERAKPGLQARNAFANLPYLVSHFMFVRPKLKIKHGISADHARMKSGGVARADFLPNPILHVSHPFLGAQRASCDANKCM